MESGFTILSFILSIASITLAIFATIFGWVTFRNTNNTQGKTQVVLAEISEKVKGIFETSTRQMDKAFDYFTSPPRDTSDVPEETAKEIEDLKEKFRNETREEFMNIVKGLGDIGGKLEAQIMEKVESLVEKTEKETGDIHSAETFLNRFARIEGLLKEIATLSLEKYSDRISGLDLINQLVKRDIIAPDAANDLLKVRQFRNNIVHGPKTISGVPDGIDRLTAQLTEYLTEKWKSIRN